MDKASLETLDSEKVAYLCCKDIDSLLEEIEIALRLYLAP